MEHVTFGLQLCMQLQCSACGLVLQLCMQLQCSTCDLWTTAMYAAAMFSIFNIYFLSVKCVELSG